jgi:hypothetical protein
MMAASFWDAFGESDAWSGDWWTRERSFGLGDQQAAKVDEAAQAQIARDDESRRGSVLEQAKAAKRDAPYAAAGRDALAQQRAIAGLDGPEAQAAAFAQIENSPQFQSMIDQSEQAILANASATGGLRGGNVQQSLAQNRPQILSDLINQQYNRFGGLASAGQQGGQFTSGLGLQYAGMRGDLNTQSGQAEAGNYLGQEQARLQARSQFANAAMGPVGILSSLGTGTPGGLLGARGPQQQGSVL